MLSEDDRDRADDPASTAPTRVGPTASPTTRAVIHAQSSQAAGPASHPQSSKNACENNVAKTTESSVTATSCTTATRQKTSNLTPRSLPCV